ncbi:MAG: CHAD domain-containing protein [Vicinamibacterales bacterium]
MLPVPWPRARLRLRRAVARRLEALAANLPEARAGDVRAVHDARVASRRLRAALPLLIESRGGGEGSRLRKRLRKLTRALGRVRELDVVAEGLGRIEAGRPDLARPVARMRKAAFAERAVRRRAMIKVLDRAEKERLGAKLSALVEEALTAENGDGHARTLSIRLARTSERLVAAARAAGDDYSPRLLHTVRIAAKKLRYGLELAGEIWALRTGSDVSRLKALQDTLGELHDSTVLLARSGSLPARTPAVAAELERFRSAVSERALRLHARYMALRKTIFDVDRRCRERFCPQLAGELAGRVAAAMEETGRDGRRQTGLPGAARDRRRARRSFPGRREAATDGERHHALPPDRRRADGA